MRIRSATAPTVQLELLVASFCAVTLLGAAVLSGDTPAQASVHDGDLAAGDTAASAPAQADVDERDSEAAGRDTTVPSLPDTTAPAAPDSAAPERVVVKYFHRTFRCETCLKFEEYSEEALRVGFAGELESGRVVWRVLELDAPENAHYKEDYGLFESSLVVSVELGGREVMWKSLGDIWGLVDDRPAFLDYVTLEVGKSLEELSRHDRKREQAAVRDED